MPIQSFADKIVESFFASGQLGKGVGWSVVKSIVKRKLDMLHYAMLLEDLKAPPANRLEKLTGDLEGYYSIRVNDQWRVVFLWTVEGPCRVRIVDYH